MYMESATRIQYQGECNLEGLPDGRGLVLSTPKALTIGWFKQGKLHGPYVQFNYAKLLAGCHKEGVHVGEPVTTPIGAFSRKINTDSFYLCSGDY